MPKAIWNSAVIADAPDSKVKIVEGNVYFPMESVDRLHLKESDKTTVCHWKGTANYYHVVVDGKMNEDAAWCYRSPAEAAKEIAGHVAFWHGVKIQN
jgi:uncharacterized protein (DUF427 family)